VKLDEFVVMPNHIHGILIIDKNETNSIEPNFVYSTNNHVETHHDAFLRDYSFLRDLNKQNSNTPFASFDSLKTFNKFGPQSENISSVIRGYKSAVKTEAEKRSIDFYWQPRFHDRIIRDIFELERIRTYILNNPLKWDLDTDNLIMHKKK
jgi:putative transposase